MNQPERDNAHLMRTLLALAEIEAAIETPSRVEAAILARWDADHAPQARSRTSRFVRGAATAAGITLVGALAWHRIADGPETVETRPDMAAQDPAGARYRTVAVVGGPLQANEPVRVVRMRVASSALNDLGIPSATQADSVEQVDSVEIDVLVGEDGVARGVRVPLSEL